MLDVQLDRLDGVVARMRAERDRILEGTAELAALGVSWVALSVPAATRTAFCERVGVLGEGLGLGA